MPIRDIQERLNYLGYDVGPVDGIYGHRTEAAIMHALHTLSPVHKFKPLPMRVIPIASMPAATMQRIIVHWSAGSYVMSTDAYEHYHFCVEGEPLRVVRGKHSVKDNEQITGAYAAHVRGINTGSIGVSLMCMAGAKEKPFSYGKFPMKREQWHLAAQAVADLCERYAIEVTDTTVLTHAEVQSNLGVMQRNKWDCTRLPFNLSLKGAKPVGDNFRNLVRQALKRR